MNESKFDLNHNLIVGCPLCEIFLDPENNIHTKLYHPRLEEVKYNDFIIIECESCKIPMVVVRDHVTDISTELWGRILYRCRKLFSENMRLRTTQRKIRDHVHYHVIVQKSY